MFKSFRTLAILTVLIFLSQFLFPAEGSFNEELLKPLVYRSMGPYRCGSWVTSFAIPSTPQKAHLYTFYVGTRNGGVWKTTNNGTTFEPVFDSQEFLSIGAVALAPSNPEIVWTGTGEAYCARSSSRGDGVYKSIDGGKTWNNMGLKDSHHIAAIIVHPANPDVVYVAAMGHLFSTNEERGVFKTTDGGKSWEKVLYINENVGAIDLIMHPKNPDILFAAMYEKYRYLWHYEEGGPNSGIFKTVNGGKTWSRLEGGLPKGNIGRIGLDIYFTNPDVMYAVIENVNKRPATEEEAKADRERKIEPAERFVGNEVYRSDDGGNSWKKMNAAKDNVGGKALYSFNKIYIDPNNDQNIFVLSDSLPNSTDGGKTWHDLVWGDFRLFKTMFGDVRTLWIDPQNSDRIFLGSDGGVHISYDGGKTCDHYTNLPLGELYGVGVDMEDPYNIYCGLQDHDSWKGPSNGWAGQVSIEDWVIVGDGDGMYNVIDPSDSRWVYNCREFGNFYRLDQQLGTRKNITPTTSKENTKLRFNWTPPIVVSPHNSEIIYVGAQMLFRSMNRGDSWQEISPDLTSNDPAKMNGRGNIKYCTITTISESPLQPGLIYVGTDDGNVNVTRNGGASWENVTANLTAAGAPANYWVTRVYASPGDAGTAYVAKTGFYHDDDKPILYKTSDYGKTWTGINGGLPLTNINAICEAPGNMNLLFAGTNSGVFVSMDGGKNWIRFKNNMPHAQVRELVIHPREHDLVVATYGRGLYIVNISPLLELNDKILNSDFYLFKFDPVVQRVTRNFGNYNLYGDRQKVTPNEPDGVTITYYLKEKTAEKVRIGISDMDGKELAVVEGPGNAGLNEVLWNMFPSVENKTGAASQAATQPQWVEPGTYKVTVTIGKNKKLTEKVRITHRQGWRVGPVTSQF